MVPHIDLELAPRIFRQLHAAIQAGLVRACHDLSEGGLAVALAEMAFAGGVGADVTEAGGMADDVWLFSESATRFLVEVAPGDVREFQEAMSEVPCRRVGQTVRESRLCIAGADGEWVVWAGLEELKEAWQKPLRW
jgi:phosphoribosylformylglycinamidine synthase